MSSEEQNGLCTKCGAVTYNYTDCTQCHWMCLTCVDRCKLCNSGHCPHHYFNCQRCKIVGCSKCYVETSLGWYCEECQITLCCTRCEGRQLRNVKTATHQCVVCQTDCMICVDHTDYKDGALCYRHGIECLICHCIVSRYTVPDDARPNESISNCFAKITACYRCVAVITDRQSNVNLATK